MGLFDPIDTNLIWPASQSLNNDLMQLLYSKHVELCEHYSVTTPEDRDIALTKIGEFTRKLPSDTKYPAIAEYVVKKLVEDEVISGEVNEKRLFGVPDIYIESRLMFSNPKHHYN